jgi:hypothetical protein
MLDPRKIFIILASIAVVLLAYLGYVHFAATPKIKVYNNSGFSSESNIPDTNANMGTIGVAKLGTVRNAFNLHLDKNKQVDREFGFDKLLHESGNEWTIEKPYMKIIEKTFVCGITSDLGKVQVELAAGQPSPKDAKLSGNVVIHIIPEPGAKIKECSIYMDDISYVGEKSLFTTQGPVHFVSPDGEMLGRGMELIYNKDRNRLELLRIIDLDFIRFKTNKNSDLVSKSKDKPQDSIQKAASADSKGSVEKINSQPADDKSAKQPYRAVLSRNVVIHYGENTAYSEQVVINNIFLGGGKSSSSKKKADQANETGTTRTVDPNLAIVNVPEPEPVDDPNLIEVKVTCDGEVLIKPAEELEESSRVSFERTVEMTGNPVLITREIPGTSNRNAETLAQCGFLLYNIDSQILDLFADGQKYVNVNLQQDGAVLKTTRSIKWALNEYRAVINGPGLLYMPAANSSKEYGDTQMNFGGVMNVYFAKNSILGTDRSPVYLNRIDLDGGFNARMASKASRLAADTAKLAFVKGTMLAQADLAGNVRFASDDGGMKAAKAKVIFAQDANGATFPKALEGSGNVEMMPADKQEKLSRTCFKADNIDYDLPNGYALAKGPVELKFFTTAGIGKKDPNVGQVPVVITAKNKAEFFQAKNEVIFDGSVIGKMIIPGERINEHRTFTCDKLVTVIGKSDKNTPILNQQSSSLESLKLLGDVVRFEAAQIVEGTTVGGIKFKCKQVDYDGINNIVVATGPGEAWVDNSKAPDVDQKDNSRFNFRGPCWARLTAFHKLTWYAKTNKIIADGEPKGLYIGYLPTKQGQQPDGRDKIEVFGTHFEIQLADAPTGRKQIDTLLASKGFHYVDTGRYDVIGERFFYDSKNANANIQGNPVLVNGVTFKAGQINLKTGAFTADNPSGAISLPPKQGKSKN